MKLLVSGCVILVKGNQAELCVEFDDEKDEADAEEMDCESHEASNTSNEGENHENRVEDEIGNEALRNVLEIRQKFKSETYQVTLPGLPCLFPQAGQYRRRSMSGKSTSKES